MEKYEEILEQRKDYLSKLIDQKSKSLKNIPEGLLRISHHEGKTQFYHRKNSTDINGTYIQNKNYKLAKRLAQADYDEKILNSAEKEKDAIQKFQSRNVKKKVEDVYSNMHPERQKLIVPIQETDEQFLKTWLAVEYNGRDFDMNSPEYYTNKGVRVRSKSEVIIGNMLENEEIPYRYEYPLYIRGYGTICPDFTILDLKQRREIIWEHFGMMDSEEYANNAIKKINQYVASGYYSGENLIITYETQWNPLNIKIVKELINHYFLDNNIE